MAIKNRKQRRRRRRRWPDSTSRRPLATYSFRRSRKSKRDFRRLRIPNSNGAAAGSFTTAVFYSESVRLRPSFLRAIDRRWYCRCVSRVVATRQPPPPPPTAWKMKNRSAAGARLDYYHKVVHNIILCHQVRRRHRPILSNATVSRRKRLPTSAARIRPRRSARERVRFHFNLQKTRRQFHLEPRPCWRNARLAESNFYEPRTCRL